jgi:hypothetical protein
MEWMPKRPCMCASLDKRERGQRFKVCPGCLSSASAQVSLLSTPYQAPNLAQCHVLISGESVEPSRFACKLINSMTWLSGPERERLLWARADLCPLT